MLPLFHVGLCVSDIDRSIEFYRLVCQMELIDRHVSESARFDELSGNSNTKLEVAMLRAGEFQLQLIEYLRSGGVALDVHHNNVGSPHLCFYVEDADAELERVKALGWVVITSDVVVLSERMRSFYTEDPDGIPVELLELTTPTS